MNIDVILCCYNQEKTIVQAIESIFKQKGNNKINIIVADDSSPDNTLEKIKSVSVPKGFSIDYLENNGNLGFVKNYKRAFAKVSANYVFILEGDDWWEPNHIMQHIKYLENNPQISMSMNRLTLLQADKNIISYSYWDDSWGDVKEWTLEEQIFANRLGNLSGCCFRGELLKKLPVNIYDIYFADWLLGMFMAESGNIAVFKDSSSTYRIWPNGQWSRMSLKEQNKVMYDCACSYDAFFNYKYSNYFKKLKIRLYPGIMNRIRDILYVLFKNLIKSEWLN